MSRYILVLGTARSDAIWADKHLFESACLDWHSQTDAFVRASTQVTSTDCHGVCKHPEPSVALANAAS